MGVPFYLGPRQSTGSVVSCGGAVVFADLKDWIGQKEKELGFSEEEIEERVRRMSEGSGDPPNPPEPLPPIAGGPKPPPAPPLGWPQPPAGGRPVGPPPIPPGPPQFPWVPIPGIGGSSKAMDWMVERVKEVTGAAPIWDGGPKVKVRPVIGEGEKGMPAVRGLSITLEWPF